MTMLLDFETRSRADLRVCGGRRYAQHPSTEVLCCVLYDTDTGDAGVWSQGDPPPCAPTDVLAAHNADGFDRFIWDRFVGQKQTHPWVDTSIAARRAGLPGDLDALGTRWLGLPKDKKASAFTKGLSRPSRAKARLGKLPELTPDVMRRVVAYCASDVTIIAEGWDRLAPFADFEPDVLAASRAVNDRGIYFDQDLAKRLLECDAENQDRAIQAAADACGWSWDETRDVCGSPAQLAMLDTPDAQAATIEAMLADTGEEPWKHALCRARQSLASIVAGKLRAGLNSVGPDSRLRDMLRYYGAHTGRWSGKVLQPHNFPRPDKQHEGWDEAMVCAAVMACMAGGPASGGLLDVLLRATLCASPGNTLVVCDFSGVEARAIAWCAGDQPALDVFASGRDAYKTAAAPMFGVAYDDVTKVQRNAGKMAELACGYQGGVNALLKIAGQNRFSFDSVDLDPQTVVDAFRRQHPALVRFWRDLQAAFVAACRGTPGRVSCFEFAPNANGRDVAIFLPSGRPIVYNDVHVANGERGPEASYLGTKFREHTYGGKIAENVIQAMCRDLLADALVRAEAAGLRPVLHVHDEIVCDVPGNAGQEALDDLHQIMLDVPDWARGGPWGAAGHHGTRYRK